MAATLKYADAILKVLATAGSVVFSSVLGYLLLGTPGFPQKTTRELPTLFRVSTRKLSQIVTRLTSLTRYLPGSHRRLYGHFRRTGGVVYSACYCKLHNGLISIPIEIVQVIDSVPSLFLLFFTSPWSVCLQIHSPCGSHFRIENASM